jgi:hypothetical protein
MGAGAAIGFLGASAAGQAAASAQGSAAAAQLAQQRADREQALKLAQPSPDELAQLQQSITLNTQDIARKQKLLDSADPALIEAGKQALDLLQGKESAALGPLKAQQARQEQQLRAKLQAQLGPGYENTTAGIQALSQLREQQNNNLVGAQQSTLGMLLGQTNNTEAFGNMQNNISNANNSAQLFGNIQGRQISALEGTQVNPALGYVGQIAGANATGQTFGNLASLSGMLSGSFASAMGGMGGGAASPTASLGNLGSFNKFGQTASNQV